MDKTYQPNQFEEKIYSSWEKSGAFKPKAEGQPFTIIMPPPNANASLHAGHGMYTVDDILIRFKRMQGFSAAWLPGTDHAGFETQFVFEKELAKKGQSRLDFDRTTLHQKIAEFVNANSGLIYQQFKRLGFSADWDKSVYAADKKVIDYIYKTFKKMEKEKFVYRDEYIVNYCVHCGTSLAELEVKHVERVDPLYYLKYGPFTLATTRPETKFGDTAVEVHPKDKRYQKWIGKEIEVDGLTGKFRLKVISDPRVDMKFGTGVVKVTPAHDFNDFDVWLKNKDEIPGPKPVIDFNGRLNQLTGKYAGMKITAAREAIVKDLKEKGLLVKIDNNYLHSVAVCYKCGRVLEPMTIPNWFIKVKGLKTAVEQAVEKNRVKFYPARFKKHMLQWLKIMHDWPISRQIVWAIRVPVWYRVEPKASNIWVWWLDGNKKLQQGNVRQFLDKGVQLSEIEAGLQKVSALTGKSGPKYVVSDKKPADGNQYLPETDTFDTWFSSGQWPMVTVTDPKRFPTDIMGTLSDILKFWVSRMIMFSLYLKQDIPFKKVYLWSMVADAKGQKMSKSKGNVINPIDLVEKYGADALRMALVFATSAGSKVILADDKVRGMRNLTNKIWNAARYVLSSKDSVPAKIQPGDKKFLSEIKTVSATVTKQLDNLKIGLAAETVYDKFWHWFCDKKIEAAKKGEISYPALLAGLRTFLKLLHPFVPFVTEAVWQQLPETKEKLLILSRWPKA